MKDINSNSRTTRIGLARSRAVELVVVGPEAPLAEGLADALVEARIPVFGATRAASAIEWSKSFCHEVAAAAGVRMARSEVCRSRAGAERAIAHYAAAGTGYVVKEDGLAAGKGVTVFGPGETAERLAPDLLDDLYTVETPDRQVLVERMQSEPGAVLLATMSFWQGIDLPGDAVTLVAIDRLPFPRPDEPVSQARRDRAGPAAFRTVDLPRAQTLLAQAAGRLIRRATDRGVVAVLDPRLATSKTYRWELIRALPPLKRTKDRDEVLAFLRQLDHDARAVQAGAPDPLDGPAAQ